MYNFAQSLAECAERLDAMICMICMHTCDQLIYIFVRSLAEHTKRLDAMLCMICMHACMHAYE